MNQYVVKLRDVGRDDVALVGGKNSSLGEMLRSLSRLGVKVPDGFATTAGAFREFLAQQQLDARIEAQLKDL
ncbi:MAG TPA: PEP/pyruvate-binding domain-containing protein, partial [Steroidobacteraceae bacterium]|nr:PEP/pyruvate-binding domain-containing protein [Steroidobacteraceae bacterium]